VATQEERRSATRVELLDAAASCLVEVGLSGFTTSEVIERSRRSTGALYGHFASKSELLEATVAHILEQLRDSFVTGLENMGDDERNIEGLLALLWTQTSDPRLGAVWEIYSAARTDAAMQATVEPTVRSHIRAIRRIVRDEVGDRFGVPNERVLKLANLVILAMQGLALSQTAASSPAVVEAVLGDMADLVQWAFDDVPDPTARPVAAGRSRS
jgi:AcrR family transcriptional regulator